MTLYEINNEIVMATEAALAAMDEETGEVDFSAVEELELARNEKVENIALYIKQLNAEAAAIKAERDNLDARMKAKSAKAERLKEYLSAMLDGQKFETPRATVSFRKSKSVEVDDGFETWAHAHAPNLLKYKDPAPNKAEIKRLLSGGQDVPFARIVENTSCTVR